MKKTWSCSSSFLEIWYIFRPPQFIFLRAAHTGLETWLAYWMENYWYIVFDIFFKRLLRMSYIWFSLLLIICTRAADIGYLSLWKQWEMSNMQSLGLVGVSLIHICRPNNHLIPLQTVKSHPFFRISHPFYCTLYNSHVHLE